MASAFESINTPGPGGYARFELAPEFGHGWTDLYRIGHGITLARGQYHFHRPYTDRYCQPPGSLTLKILATGEMQLQQPGQRQPVRYHGSGVMLRHSPTAQVLERHMAGRFSGVSIDVPAALVAELLDDQHRHLDTFSDTEILFDNRHSCHAMGLSTAATLLSTPMHNTVGRLQIEAAALQMVSALAGHEPWQQAGRLPHRQRIAVADARDILEQEFAEPHSIAALARRVGLNECYLKTAFKAVTGQTIAAYLREVRMLRARRLLETGEVTVLQACQFVGYCNPGQFAAAFRRSHGIAPGSLKGVAAGQA